MKPVLFTFGFILTLLIGCTHFPSRYENIENDRIRPLAIICDPPEAVPGDTVTIRLIAMFPMLPPPAISWSVALDYGVDLYAQQVIEKHVVSLASLMVPGSDSLGLRFSFIVPESTLLYSTQLNSLFGASAGLQGVPEGFSVNDANSLLKILPDTLLPDSLRPLVDNFSAKIKLRAHMESGITLDVTKLLTIRYSRKFNTPNVNKNPILHWIGVLFVSRENLTDPDSALLFPHTLQYLYNSDNPAIVNDTISIDNGISYFLIADSGINGFDTTIQQYAFLSQTDSEKLDRELYNFSWFYTNLDYNSSMIKDSLIVLSDGGDETPLRSLLPPVDTRMQNFQLYLVVRAISEPTSQWFPQERHSFKHAVSSNTPWHISKNIKDSLASASFL